MDHFASLVRHFRKEFPEYRFSVRRVKTPHFGYCSKRPDGSFRICISDAVECHTQLVLLPHEIGHMLSWEKDTHHSDHGRHFGIAYARAWQSYVRWLET